METVGVGMLGLGTVGVPVAERLISAWGLLGERAGAVPVLRRVAVRDPGRRRGVDLKNVRVDGDAAAVVADPSVDVVVEVMGGVEPATSLITQALTLGKPVVTANKAVIAASGPRLATVAAAHATSLRFEGAVGAGLPIVALLRDSLRSDRISRIDAVINGTTNVILTRMRRDRMSIAEALAEAQRLGYAEADSSVDVDGWDAVHKLVIMAWLAFGVHVPPDLVERRGIGDIDAVDVEILAGLGHAVRLLAHAEASRSGAIHLRVRPTAVAEGHLLFDVDDSDNAVIISSDLAGTVMLRGLGAGGESTASAVLGDIVAAVRGRGSAPPAPPGSGEPPATLGDEDVEVAGYIRLRLDSGADARGLTLAALIDRGVRVLETVDLPEHQLVVLTGIAPRAVHDRALETLDTMTAVTEIACSLDRAGAPP